MPARSRTIIRIEALYRYARLKYLARLLPVILVTEYPKSGASWLAQMLAEITGYDFPRQQFPTLKPSIFHGHYRLKHTTSKTIVFWRDPRDIMVSWYHHCLFKSDKNNHRLVEQITGHLNFDDFRNVKANLSEFIEYSFTSSISPRFSYNDFFDTWFGRDDVIYSSYEKLKLNTAEELSVISKKLGFPQPSRKNLIEIARNYSFSKQASRAPGAEVKSNYLRKGIVGDWKNYFTPISAKTLNDFLDRRLIQLGYEQDCSWIDSVE